MIPVDWPAATNAEEISGVLAGAGLHPEYDTRPLNAVRGRSFAKATIYVPDAEAEQARDLLAAWYATRGEHVERQAAGIWRGLFPPFMIAIGIGAAAGVLAGQFSIGLLIAFLTFIPAVAVWHRRRRA